MLPVIVGCAQQGSGPAPLEVELSEDFIEISIFTEESQSTNPGDIEVNCIPTGGTQPYQFQWVLNRESDDDNAFSINMGTTNQSKFLPTLTTTYTGPPDFTQIPPGNLPPTPADFSIFCIVTDDNGVQESAGMGINVSAE